MKGRATGFEMQVTTRVVDEMWVGYDIAGTVGDTQGVGIAG